MHLFCCVLVVGASSVSVSEVLHFWNPLYVERILNLQLLYAIPIPNYFCREIRKSLSVVLLVYLLGHFVRIFSWQISWLRLLVSNTLLSLLHNLLVLFLGNSSLIKLISLYFRFVIKHLLKGFDKIRVEERLLILKEFWFLLDEFYPVYPVSMNCSMVISVSEIYFHCVWCSHPSDLTSKSLVVWPSIFNFVSNSAFLKQLKRRLNLLGLFLDVHLILGFDCHFIRLVYDRIL